MNFAPIEASDIIVKKYKRYLKTIFKIEDEDYQRQLNEQLEERDVLSKGPYLDVVDSFEQGKSLSQLIEEGVIPSKFKKLNFLMERPLHYHQESALRKSLMGNNLVVSTGTGSGKTESFLIPILADLVAEDERGELTSGVRALFIYPMNALANDQMERLREILSNYPEITYGSYTGQTKQKRNQALQEYRILNKGKEPKRNELISREEMVERPPNILLTNYAMLEYLMIRPKENSFFNGENARKCKYIVLDEAHVYSGSTGIEVSMLLRRLKSSLGTKKLQYILTSATLGDEKQNKDVAQFAMKLCSSPFLEENIIRAKRRKPERKEFLNTHDWVEYQQLAQCLNLEKKEILIKKIQEITEQEQINEPQSFLYDWILQDQNYWKIRELLEEKPQTIEYLANQLQCSKSQIQDFVTVATFGVKENVQLFDAKYHMFIKACDSAFITLGESKRLMLTRSNKLYEKNKEYAVFEIAVCTFCHKIYLIGQTDSSGYFVQNNKNSGLEGKEILYLGEDVSDEDEEHSLKREDIEIIPYQLCTRCGKIFPINAKAQEKCEHSKSQVIVQKIKMPKEKKNFTKCIACENINTNGVLRQFFTGQEAVTSVLGTALFEALPSYHLKEEVIEKEEEEDEFGFEELSNSGTQINSYLEHCAKQFIAFSDSRQAAAFFASYFEKTYRTILYKRLIIETLKNRSFSGNVEQFVAFLQANFEKYEIVTNEGISAEKEAWKAILKEMVDNYSGNALENLGFYEFTVERSKILAAKALGLTSEEIADIINICLKMMMQEVAISYPILLNKKEKEFFTYNGHEGSFTLSDSSKIACSSFIPTTVKAKNRRTDYVTKIFDIVAPNTDKGTIIKFLEAIWKQMKKNSIIINEGNNYKVNVQKILINDNATFYQCNLCKKVTSHNVRGVCPTFRCQGKLHEVNLEEVFDENHYYRMYQDMEIRNLRIVEHTAQLNKEKAYKYQTLFKEKKIDVLSCSTTFEMGVDVGSLETVFMRNMPPSPANYAQRAGRAGRSIQATAYALTFCTRGNHDFTYFNSPETMIRGNIKPPIFKVENEKIAIRHVFATVFGFFWKKYPDYFSTVSCFVEEKDGMRGIQQLNQYLEAQPENLKQFLLEFLPKELSDRFQVENFGWIPKLLGEQGVLTKAIEEYMYEVELLEKSVYEILQSKGTKKVDYLNQRINNYKNENILSFLSKKSVLPKYGFPVDTVELSLWNKNTKEKLELELQRDMAMAISEYAPGAQIVADGNLIESRYVKKIPNIGWKMFDYVYCECQTLNIEPHTGSKQEGILEKCKVCGEKLDRDKIQTFIVPEFGFEVGEVTKAGLIKPKRTYSNEVSYVGYRNDMEVQTVEDRNKKYDIAFSQNDEMAIINPSNFYICDECGYTYLSTTKFKNTISKSHSRSNGMKCDNSNLKKYALGYRFDTDVIQIRFWWPQITEYPQALSILYGIMKGTCSYLNIEEKDISGCLRYFYNTDMNTGNFSIILYDRTPGGAGHVKRLKDTLVFEEVLKETMNMMKQCNCGGEKMDTSCYHCLRSYANQKVHDMLQRKYVIEFLSKFLA